MEYYQEEYPEVLNKRRITLQDYPLRDGRDHQQKNEKLNVPQKDNI